MRCYNTADCKEIKKKFLLFIMWRKDKIWKKWNSRTNLKYIISPMCTLASEQSLISLGVCLNLIWTRTEKILIQIKWFMHTSKIMPVAMSWLWTYHTRRGVLFFSQIILYMLSCYYTFFSWSSLENLSVSAQLDKEHHCTAIYYETWWW